MPADIVKLEYVEVEFFLNSKNLFQLTNMIIERICTYMQCMNKSTEVLSKSVKILRSDMNW